MDLAHQFLFVFLHDVFYESVDIFLLVTIVEKIALLILEYKLELDK